MSLVRESLQGKLPLSDVSVGSRVAQPVTSDTGVAWRDGPILRRPLMCLSQCPDPFWPSADESAETCHVMQGRVRTSDCRMRRDHNRSIRLQERLENSLVASTAASSSYHAILDEGIRNWAKRRTCHIKQKNLPGHKERIPVENKRGRWVWSIAFVDRWDRLLMFILPSNQ